ncbi:unnamed protein product [Cylicocyclus nassatus]|uniref:Uncharacterized protein n=1 Tax=Cylicocyclus nassatus TaxID=53992 RepID=A0AA36DRJ0_CYLNA|nr:unnamed protein product [Cylicocyclus nassatus]
MAKLAIDSERSKLSLHDMPPVGRSERRAFERIWNTHEFSHAHRHAAAIEHFLEQSSLYSLTECCASAASGSPRKLLLHHFETSLLVFKA